MYIAVMRFLAAFLLGASLLVPAPAREKQVISDDHIHDEVMRRLVADPDVKGGNLQVEVKDGVVTLRGQVDSLKARSKAEKLTKKVRGVRNINDQLTLPQ